jgi:hypothetical protein
MRNYTLWLKIAIIFQFINAIFHTISLFITPQPNNETEKQLYSLMDTYQFDLGAGFHRTMNELTLVFSACLCLLCLLGGLLNWYLLRKKIEPGIMKGVITINLVVFGILSVLTILFTFLLPIISIGLITVFLILSLATINTAIPVRHQAL